MPELHGICNIIKRYLNSTLCITNILFIHSAHYASAVSIEHVNTIYFYRSHDHLKHLRKRINILIQMFSD